MSKSTFEILDSLETETSVPGQDPKMQPHKLQREQFPDSATYEDEDRLLDWFRNNNNLHSGMQKGVKSHLIDLRRVFKFCKKDDIWSPSYGQQNSDNFQWEIHRRPEQKAKLSPEQAKNALAQMDKEELKALLKQQGLL